MAPREPKMAPTGTKTPPDQKSSPICAPLGPPKGSPEPLKLDTWGTQIYVRGDRDGKTHACENVFLASTGCQFCHLGASWDRLGTVLGTSWGHLEIMSMQESKVGRLKAGEEGLLDSLILVLWVPKRPCGGGEGGRGKGEGRQGQKQPIIYEARNSNKHLFVCVYLDE